LGIVLAIVTERPNIFSAPEYSFGTGNLAHVLAHVFIGTIAGTLVPWAVGSLILTIARKTLSAPSRAET